MPLFLQNRDKAATELMDDPECNYEALINTYQQFRIINALISRWRTVYQNFIVPYARTKSGVISLLDIGFGGGDIPGKLAGWAERDGIKLHITGIETDQRAFDFVKQRTFPKSIHFQLASPSDLVKKGMTFDFVISNHLLHHLGGEELLTLLREARQLSSYAVLFNDIERSDIGYLLFNILSRPVFRSSFITHDGLISIKRSYTFRELKQKAPPGWKVKRIFPYRLLMIYFHE